MINGEIVRTSTHMIEM